MDRLLILRILPIALCAGLLLPDPGFSEPLPMGLAEAKRIALERNEMLRAARSQVAAMAARKLQSWAGHLPTVRITENAVRTNDAVNAFGFKLKQEGFTQADFAVDALNAPAPITDYQTKLEVRQPLFNGGRAWHGRAQAEAGLAAARADLRRGEDEVSYQAAQAYWGLVLAKEALAAVRQGLETARAAEAAADARYRGETAPLSDLLAARVRVAELRGQEIEASNGLAQAEEGLSLVMGLEMSATVVPTDTLGDPGILPDMATSLQQVEARRPDLVAAQQRAEAAARGVGRARAGYLPNLNAFAEWTLDADGPFSRQGESWMVGAIASWDLFSGMKTIGEVRAAKAQAEAAQAVASFKEAEAAREARQAFREVEAARSQLAIAGEGLTQSEEWLRITQLRYQEGLATSMDLLGAESGLTAARVRRLRALHDLNVGSARVAYAIGSSAR